MRISVSGLSFQKQAQQKTPVFPQLFGNVDVFPFCILLSLVLLYSAGVSNLSTMADNYSLPDFGPGILVQMSSWADDHVQQHIPWLATPRGSSAALLVLTVVLGYLLRGKKSNLRVYNPKKWWELTTMRAKRDFDANAPGWIESWFSQNNKPLRFIVDSGYCTILPSSMADEFRKMKELCMYKFLGTVNSPPSLSYLTVARLTQTGLSFSPTGL